MEPGIKNKKDLRKYVLAELNAAKTSPLKKKFREKKDLKAMVREILQKPANNQKVKKPVGAKEASKVRSVKPAIKPVKKVEKKKKGWLAIVTLALLVILVLVGVVLVDVYGIYNWGWRGGANYQAAKIFNLPAGIVNGQEISLAEYWDDLNLLQASFAKDREGINSQALRGNNFEDKVFYRLVAEKLVDKELSRYQRPVTQAEIDNKMSAFIAQEPNEAAAGKVIKNIYGLELSEFKDKILRFLVAREKLQGLIAEDESLAINQQAKKQAKEILAAALMPGANFSNLAKQHTDDELGVYTGGEMGWLVKGQSSPELEKVLFAMPENTVYDKLIKNKTGYHIVKLEKIMIDPDTAKTSVKARQILIQVDVDKYIKELMDSAEIKKLVR